MRRKGWSLASADSTSSVTPWLKACTRARRRPPLRMLFYCCGIFSCSHGQIVALQQHGCSRLQKKQTGYHGRTKGASSGETTRMGQPGTVDRRTEILLRRESVLWDRTIAINVIAFSAGEADLLPTQKAIQQRRINAALHR
jgi:hypothetical protein